MPHPRQTLGTWGETLAAEYLTRKGYTVLARNVRTAHGEIDLVARQDKTIVFLEVKTRTSTVYGHPETSITTSKQIHLIASAQAYLQSHPDLEGDWRIDVLAIHQRKKEKPEILHFENAVTG